MARALVFFKKRLFLFSTLTFSASVVLFFLFGAQQGSPLKEGVYVAEEHEKVLFLNTIESSKEYIWVGAYKLHHHISNDPKILNCLNNLSKRKIPIFVFLESRLSKEEKRFSSEQEKANKKSPLHAFETTGAHMVFNNPAFNNIHFKIMLNEQRLILGTTNFDGDNQNSIVRDFFVVLENSTLRDETKKILNNIKNNHAIQWPSYYVQSIPSHSTQLSWGPFQHKQHLLEMIKLAKNSIHIYQQDMQDPSISEALLKKITSGIKVKILMSYHPFSEKYKNKNLPNLKKIASKGGYVRLTGKTIYKNQKPLHIHAKVMIVDAQTAHPLMYLGSANFYEKVLDPKHKNLNVGIITIDTRYISPVIKVFESDWSLHHEHQL